MKVLQNLENYNYRIRHEGCTETLRRIRVYAQGDTFALRRGEKYVKTSRKCWIPAQEPTRGHITVGYRYKKLTEVTTLSSMGSTRVSIPRTVYRTSHPAKHDLGVFCRRSRRKLSPVVGCESACACCAIPRGVYATDSTGCRAHLAAMKAINHTLIAVKLAQGTQHGVSTFRV